jgi:rhodanese-related sulfurtransferase
VGWLAGNLDDCRVIDVRPYDEYYDAHVPASYTVMCSTVYRSTVCPVVRCFRLVVRPCGYYLRARAVQVITHE